MSSNLAISPRFDWYSATITEQPHAVIEGLRQAMNIDAVRDCRARLGYRQGFEFWRDGNRIATMFCGGDNGMPHAFATGADAPEFAEVVRRLWPVHRVSRMDSALDFVGEGSWDRITALAMEFADEYGVKCSVAGDWLRGEGGRTLYLGSRKSQFFLRIYEKGKQLRGELIEATEGADGSSRRAGDAEAAPSSAGTNADSGLAEIDPTWVRVECEVKPVREMREAAAMIPPRGAWGMSAWGGDFARELLGIDVERVRVSMYRPRDDERAIRAVITQYWRAIEALAASEGSWEAFGRRFGELYAETVKKP